MRLFERILAEGLRKPDSPVKTLMLGWHASAVVLEDGRCGLGAVPLPGQEVLRSTPRFPRHLVEGTAHEVLQLLVSPYPQEFAAASAVASALLPPEEPGEPLEALAPLPGGDQVALLGYDHELVPLLRRWGWHLIIFDDLRPGVDVLPSWTEAPLLRGAPWVWVAFDALRDRRMLALAPLLREHRGAVLQGPGVPWHPSLLRELGFSHLVLPTWQEDHFPAILTHISAGGNPWHCAALEWRCFSLHHDPSVLFFPEEALW